MDGDRSAWKQMMVLTLGIALALWGVSGFILGRRMGETGFFYGPDYVVRSVMEGSAAEAAGIQIGDRVVSVDGIPAQELPMQSRQRERRVGEAATVVVEREGESLALNVRFGEILPEHRVRATRAMVVNLAFLAFGLWAYVSAGTPLALVLAWIGLTRAAGSFPGPHLGPRFEGIAASIQLLGLVAFSYLLLRLFMEVPRRRRILESGKIQKIFMGSMVLALLVCVVEVAIHPAWYMISGFILLALIAPVYLLLFIVVPWSWLNASHGERSDSGLSLMLLGYLVGLGPVILRLLVEAISGVTLPGSDWIPLVEVAVPFFLALGVMRQASRRNSGLSRSESLAAALS